MNHLFCKSCESQYTETTKPFLLPCGHNLCVKCISKRLYSNRCFFCPFDSTFMKIDSCKLNLNLLKQSTKQSKPSEKTPKKKEKIPMPKIITPVKSVQFLEPPKENMPEHNESIESINTEYLYPCASEKKMLKKNLEISPRTKACERSFVNLRPTNRPKGGKYRKKSRMQKESVGSSFYEGGMAFVAASVVGGALLLSNFSSNKPAGIVNAVKETGSLAIKGLLGLVKKGN